MQLFWQKGYAETSLRELVNYTGVAHAGLYSTFGNKQQLFEAALLHYKRVVMDHLLAEMETEAASVAEVRHFFDRILQIIAEGKFDHGCLMTNTVLEFAEETAINRSIFEIVTSHMERMRAAFANALGHAAEQGILPGEKDPYLLADFLVTIFNGLAVMARSKATFAHMENSVRVAMQALG